MLRRYLIIWLVLSALAAFYWPHWFPGAPDVFAKSKPLLSALIAVTMFAIGWMLPHDEVRGIALRADGSAWVATHQGLSRIYEEPMTLARKAAHFEERIQKRHYRMGFVADIDLAGPGDVENFTYEATDNDGLWTALYVAAECYRYAATGDSEAPSTTCSSTLVRVA